jgi:hypothetical protein
MMTASLEIPDHWDEDTIGEAAVEIESYLDYEEQSGRLDDRTREGLVIALQVLTDVRKAYAEREAGA